MGKTSSAPPRVWWSTWVAVAAWALLALLAVVPALLGWGITAFYTFDNAAGTDMTVDSGHTPAWLQVLCVVAMAGALSLPVFVSRWARKHWLGWFLVGWAITGVVLIVGLAMFNIV